MHHHCLSCSADLGRNDAVETLPIGRRLAFDAWKGRLWVVCPRCHRWNLTPIEERWEPVEELEKLFRDSRLRVQSENIGLARLPDGTTLIRVGQALPGELAAWRYGEELRRRRWKSLLTAGAVVAVGGGLAMAGPVGLAAVGVPAGLAGLAVQALAWTNAVRMRRRPIYRLEAQASPTGSEFLLRRLHLDGAVLTRDADGAPSLWLPVALDDNQRRMRSRMIAPRPLRAKELLQTPPLDSGGLRIRGCSLASGPHRSIHR